MSDLSTSRCARLASFTHTDQFALVAEQLVADLRDEGLDFSSLSVYLLDRQTRKGRNYYFCPQPVGYCESSFDEGMAPLAALLQNQPRMWQDPHAPHPLWYLTVPSLTGAAEVANGRAFNQRERDLLSSQVDFLLLLVNRHRELESIERQTSQSTHIDLVVNALMNFPTMRSVDTPSQAARRIVEFIVDYLPYDRAGIFLVDGAYLRGTWGVDQDGRIASIAHTAFPLKNSHPEQFSEAALIALGKLDYFLTQDLDGAAARSTEGNIGANLAVPLRLEGHIMGVLSVDNSFSRHSILEYQVQPLLLLATQAAAAIGITRLRTGTDSKQKISAKTDDGTRPSSAPRKDESIRFEDIIGTSQAIHRVLRLAHAAAQTSDPVLILGESGTGKDLLARAIHSASPRSENSLMAVNGASLSSGLEDSELFGHVKGAFTSASNSSEGIVTTADGGTLFLDEVGDLSPASQAKLLRCIERGEVRPVGAALAHKVDVRIVAATNHDLRSAVAKGLFRDDLYYRLAVISIYIPPLRQRSEDIPPLIEHFAQHIAIRRGVSQLEIAPEAMELLLRYPWPGNARQLDACLRQAALLAARRIEADDLPAEIRQPSNGQSALMPTLAQLEKQHILQVLNLCAGNRQQAQEMLDISRATLQRRLKEYGIRS